MALDPAQNVHEQLLPHIHLISTYRYPQMMRLELSDVAKWLMVVPKIAQREAPFFWTYLDSPRDGTILLTWQPLTRLGTDFASDGYVWVGPEVYYQQDIGNGLVLEIYYQRAGFRPGEQLAAHSRRRFRLVPAKVAGPNAPQVDLSLWIVHYGPAESNDRIPVSMVQPDPRQHAIMNYRLQLQRAGQIARKEFMLSDRAYWPQIPLPREGRGQPMHPGPGGARGVPQQIAYPPHHPSAPMPPSKRQRHPAQGPAQQQPMMAQGPPPVELAYDDEEDTARGDLFDHLTPRDVSLDRYKQNHEWMEEILSSPYRMDQIALADLGLGLKGELSSLTEGIFEAQGVEALAGGPKKPHVGHLDKSLANEFRKRVSDKVKATNAEIAKMKEDHEKMVAKFEDGSVIKDAEQELRFAIQDTVPATWRLESQADDGEEVLGRWGQSQNKKVEDIVSRVEAVLGKRTEVVQDVRRIQDGGYIEPAPEPEPEPEPVLPPPAAVVGELPAAGAGSVMSRQPSQAETPHSVLMGADSDIDMGGTAAGLLDQMHTGFSSHSTPVNSFPTPQPQLSTIPSTAATPANVAAPSPQPAEPSGVAAQPQDESKPEDVAMEDADRAKEGMATTPDQGTDSGDWVVVPQGGVSSAEPPDIAAMATVTATDPVIPTSMSADPTNPPTDTGKPISAAPTPADETAAPDAPDVDNNDFSSLGDLDNGAADLDDYKSPSLGGADVALDGGLDMHMDVEDSAFGDAFHTVDRREDDNPVDGGL